MNTLQLAKFKAHLLMELGDSSTPPFLYDIVYDPTVEEEPEELDPEDYEDEDEMYQAYQAQRSEPNFEYEFRSPKSDILYTVGIKVRDTDSPKLIIDFDADGSYQSTDKGEMFRVMSTVVAITKEVVEEKLPALGIDKIDAIEYSPSDNFKPIGDKSRSELDPDSKESDDPISKRDMLYRNYIKSAFPGKKIIFKYLGNDRVIRAEFPKSKELQEKVKGVQWLQKPYFWAAQGHFLLSPNIAKIINGEKAIRVDAFHITSAKNASRLKQLEGSKKSISAMTKVPQYSLEDLSGIHSHGVMFSLQGNVLLKSIDDIMSTPDESGRRWINISLINEKLGKQYRQYMSQDSRLDDLRSRLESDYDKKVGTNWNSVYNDKLVDANELSLSKEELREFLTLWISRSKTWIKENLAEFIQALSSKKYGQTQYDEVVVNQIELTGAVANLADIRGTKEQINQMKQDIEDAVGPDNVVYIDSSNYDRANKQSNRATVTNFILGQGGKIGNDD
jgi:hypothetical protein